MYKAVAIQQLMAFCKESRISGRTTHPLKAYLLVRQIGCSIEFLWTAIMFIQGQILDKRHTANEEEYTHERLEDEEEQLESHSASLGRTPTHQLNNPPNRQQDPAKREFGATQSHHGVLWASQDLISTEYRILTIFAVINWNEISFGQTVKAYLIERGWIITGLCDRWLFSRRPLISSKLGSKWKQTQRQRGKGRRAPFSGHIVIILYFSLFRWSYQSIFN